MEPISTHTHSEINGSCCWQIMERGPQPFQKLIASYSFILHVFDRAGIFQKFDLVPLDSAKGHSHQIPKIAQPIGAWDELDHKIITYCTGADALSNSSFHDRLNRKFSSTGWVRLDPEISHLAINLLMHLIVCYQSYTDFCLTIQDWVVMIS